MKPIFHPELVNGPFEDPAVYVDFLFERRALLFDLGDISALPPKKVLRLSHIFVSHAHMDHFIGFDHILRICLGRERELNLYGPPQFIEQVGHKLAAYTWNLTESYDTDFTVRVYEIHDNNKLKRARFRCQNRFQLEQESELDIVDRVLVDEESFRVRGITLDHQTPCLAYTLEEKHHINVWKNRLEQMGLATGAWLVKLKSAIRRKAPDDTPVEVTWQKKDKTAPGEMPLGDLRNEIVTITPGQKVTYVVDCAYSRTNVERIRELSENSDVLFIETVFLEADRDRGQRTAHLTAAQAGLIAAEAHVKRLVPIHFSPRYSDRPNALREEAMAAFAKAGSS